VKARVLLLVLLLVAGLAAATFLTRPGGAGAPPGAPPGVGAADLEAHNRAVGLMGTYDFAAAVPAFEALARRHPGWLDVRVDLAIALLNRARPDTRDLDRSLKILLDVLRRRPDDLRAAHCAGLVLLYRGHVAEARPWFERVARADPRDAYAACFLADCLYQLDRLDDAAAWYARARQRDPYLRSAWYGSFRILRAQGKDAQAQKMLATFKRLGDNPQARVAEIKYTRMGPHAMVRAIRLHVPPPRPPQGPVFAARVPLPVQGQVPWAPGPAPCFTACDLDGDGVVDLFGAGALAGDVPNAVLLRRGDAFVLARDHPLARVPGVRTALWGDLDNDGRTDVVFCCRGPNRAFRQEAGGVWKELGPEAGLAGGDHDTRDGALLDVDQDGDLDVVTLDADGPFHVLANHLDGTFAPLPADAGLSGDGRPAVGLLAADLDADRDLDLVVLHARPPQEVFVNDRLWRWRPGTGFDALRASPAVAAVATDADADGQVEVQLLTGTALETWTRAADGTWARARAVPSSARRVGVLDAQGDGALDLLLAGPGDWSVRAAADLAPGFVPAEPAGGALPFFWSAGRGLAVVGRQADGAPCLWRPGSGRHPFLALSFSGRHHASDQMRSNADGRGLRAVARVGPRWTVRDTDRPLSGPGQSLQPLAFGLAGQPRMDFVDLAWSDGLLQTERDLAPGVLHRVEETQRQTSSCPVLFAWDGRRLAFVTDLLGVGGVGFWVAPHTWAPPNPRETVLLPPGLPVPRAKRLELALGEPMEETCYLDGARLEAVDVPPGWDLTVDERMAVDGPLPSGHLVFHRTIVHPVRAHDQAGRDVRAALHDLDRSAAPPGAGDPRFIGRTAEQVLTLEFDRPLDGGPGRPVLLADGWIEYPYAQTLFAAWQAHAAYDAPTIEARGADGTWHTLLAHYGYPAGMPRQGSVPLDGLPAGTRALRVRTTMEIYWDRLAVAWAEPCPRALRTPLALRGATLRFAGFARRHTAPQRLPSYDHADHPPLWDARHQDGFFTRFGPVQELLAETDDAVVIFGPGEEVAMSFDAPAAAPPAGWTRRYVLRATGWCKDMDLYTKDGETVGPIPVRDPAAGPGPARARLHPRYQTRYRSGR
jgi:Flp pilus assembly protein TadD